MKVKKIWKCDEDEAKSWMNDDEEGERRLGGYKTRWTAQRQTKDGHTSSDTHETKITQQWVMAVTRTMRQRNRTPITSLCAFQSAGPPTWVVFCSVSTRYWRGRILFIVTRDLYDLTHDSSLILKDLWLILCLSWLPWCMWLVTLHLNPLTFPSSDPPFVRCPSSYDWMMGIGTA